MLLGLSLATRMYGDQDILLSVLPHPVEDLHVYLDATNIIMLQQA